ncbi:MAG: hypothetical protein GY701_28875 [Sulfitobacter sp.]|nr:hypothetical protein [Sulfitobacter sp.]
MSWFLTSFAVGDDYIEEMSNMVASFRKHHPEVPVITGIKPFTEREWGPVTKCKPLWLLNVWKSFSHLGDMLWVDADARFRRTVQPREKDFTTSASYYGQPPVAVTGTMWFRGNGATNFLTLWRALSLTDEHEIDEPSYRAACKMLQITPLEIPRAVSSVCSTTSRGYKGQLPHDSAIVHWNMSRKVVGGKEGWPPPEQERHWLDV